MVEMKISKARHSVSEPDFVIEKDGKQIIIEVESNKKKSLAEFNSKVGAYDKPVIIVVPIEKARERYSYLPCVQNGKARIVLIPELADCLKNG